MKNKTISYWLAGTLALAFLGGILDFSDDFYTLLGLGMVVFGGIASYRLYHLGD